MNRSPMPMVLLVLLMVAPAAGPLIGKPPGATPPDLSDHGTFKILTDGKQIGTENFAIRVRPDEIDAQGEVHLQVVQNGKQLEIRTSSRLLLDSQLRPLSYTWNQKGAASSQLSIDFRSKPARGRYKTANGQDERRDVNLQKDVVVLDDNNIHHYELALARYDQAKGGVQVLHAFIPQEAMPGEVSLKFVGLDSGPVTGEKRALRHFLLTTELAQIDLWADDQGHLQAVSTPDAHFQAVREE